MYLFTQVITDRLSCDEETSGSETAKCLLRQQEASPDNKPNLETEDWSQRPYLDKLDFEKKAIHLICPGAFSLWISKNTEAILDLDWKKEHKSTNYVVKTTSKLCFNPLAPKKACSFHAVLKFYQLVIFCGLTLALLPGF